MKKLLALLLILTGCSTPSNLKTLQINYIEDGEIKYLLLNVKENHPYDFEVISQENMNDKPTFIITEIFDYDQTL